MGKAPWRLASSGGLESFSVQSLWTRGAQISKEEVTSHCRVFQPMERSIWGPENALGNVLPSPWERGDSGERHGD